MDKAQEFEKRITLVNQIIDAYSEGEIDGVAGNANDKYPQKMSEVAEHTTIAYNMGWVVGKATGNDDD